MYVRLCARFQRNSLNIYQSEKKIPPPPKKKKVVKKSEE